MLANPFNWRVRWPRPARVPLFSLGLKMPQSPCGHSGTPGGWLTRYRPREVRNSIYRYRKIHIDYRSKFLYRFISSISIIYGNTSSKVWCPSDQSFACKCTETTWPMSLEARIREFSGVWKKFIRPWKSHNSPTKFDVNPIIGSSANERKLFNQSEGTKQCKCSAVTKSWGSKCNSLPRTADIKGHVN